MGNMGSFRYLGIRQQRQTCAGLDRHTIIYKSVPFLPGLHRLSCAETYPTPGNAVDEPDRNECERQPDDDDPQPERQHEEQEARNHPEQAVPEGPNLPAEVRLEPGAANVAALHVVEDHGHERRPTREECADDGRSPHDARRDTKRVQAVDHSRPAHVRAFGIPTIIVRCGRDGHEWAPLQNWAARNRARLRERSGMIRGHNRNSCLPENECL